MARKARPLWVLVVALAACEDGDLARIEDIGDPCRSASRRCLDETTARVCEDRIWVERDCASICAELGPAYEASGCEIECVCTLVDPSACTPGTRTCIDESTVGLCDANQELSSTPCADVCASAGLNEVGCLDDAVDEQGSDAGACWCTGEGTPCSVESAPTCVDGETVATCEAGTWEFAPCEVVCNGPGVCDPHQQPAGCACSLAP